MEIATMVFLGLIFASLYLSILFLILFFENKKYLFESSESKNLPFISVIIPAYNEEESIVSTVQTVLNIDYPKKLLEVIVVNDGSTDDTLMKVQKFKNNIIIISKNNSGKADSINVATKIARGEIIAVIDADSFPEKDAFKHMVGFFENKNVAAVTSTILVKNKESWLGKVQSIEYPIIAWARKLMDCIGGVYVTPGGLSMYRKDALIEVGGFDKSSITEDIEIAWNLLSHGYRIRMSLLAKSYTIVPVKIKDWWRQRTRWNVGGFQAIYKYKSTTLNKKYGMLGLFVIPFVSSSFFLSMTGFLVSLYFLYTKIIPFILNMIELLKANFPILKSIEFHFTPSVLGLFWTFISILFVIYLYYGLKTVARIKLEKSKLILITYIFFYIPFSPFLIINAIIRSLKGNIKW